MISSIKPSAANTSPLVRHLLKILQKHARTIDVSLVDSLFPNSTLMVMVHGYRQCQSLTFQMKHRDPTVRKVAVQLMGKKSLVELASSGGTLSGTRTVHLLTQMWNDKNSKVDLWFYICSQN